MPISESTHRHLLNASWLILLRWVAAGGQMITISFVSQVLEVPLNLWPLGVVVAITLGSNLLLHTWLIWQRSSRTAPLQPHQWDLLLGLVMTMDMISLTALLYFSGGINNPFYLFFFVNLSLSAVVLSRAWAWSMNGLSIICFALLLYSFLPMDYPGLGKAIDPVRALGEPNLQHVGLFIAFAACSSVITYFMTRLTRALRRQEGDLRRAQQAQAKSEKLEALGTLAAGAAHELASPLSTIAVVAKELEQMARQPIENQQELIHDVQLIRSQVNHCRKILDRMSRDAGQTVGETMQRISVSQMWQMVADGMPQEAIDRVQVTIDPQVAEETRQIPVEALGQSLRGLVQNAIDYEPLSSRVEVRIGFDNQSTPGFLAADSAARSSQGSPSSGRAAAIRRAQRFGTQLRELLYPESISSAPTATWGERRIVWVIRDHGLGMDRHTLSRISEPFFTTKPPGQGMGLGVFLAKNVIERLGGELHIDSVEGVGTTVKIILN